MTMKRQVRTKPVIQASDHYCATFLSVLVTTSLFNYLSVYCSHMENFLCNCCMVKGFKFLFLPSLSMVVWWVDLGQQPNTHLSHTLFSYGMWKKQKEGEKSYGSVERVGEKALALCKLCLARDKILVYQHRFRNKYTTHSTIHANMMVKSSPATPSVDVKILSSCQTI